MSWPRLIPGEALAEYAPPRILYQGKRTKGGSGVEGQRCVMVRPEPPLDYSASWFVSLTITAFSDVARQSVLVVRLLFLGRSLPSVMPRQVPSRDLAANRGVAQSFGTPHLRLGPSIAGSNCLLNSDATGPRP